VAGRLGQPTRVRFRHWLESEAAPRAGGRSVALAVEGCTGWRYVVEELVAVGAVAHLADPAETAWLRGPKKRAKTDRADARLLRTLLLEGRLPESWIPPAQVLEIRTAVRLYHDLMTDRAAWLHRIHATLFHQGAVAQTQLLRGDRNRLHDSELLSAEGKAAVQSILRVIDALDGEINRIRQQLQRFAGKQPGCKELQKEYGIGKLTSVIIWSEIGDCRRFSSSDGAVRHSGLDVTVYSSNGKRSSPHLSRQGQPLLRWALYEAALAACRPSSPDHADYLALKARGLSHARLADDRAQARAPLLPRAARARARRPGARRGRLSHRPSPDALRHAHPSSMITLPASSRSCCGSHPRVAAHQRPSGRSHSTRTDRSTITSPTTRSRTQISPGIHGATQHPNNHNHSPPP